MKTDENTFTLENDKHPLVLIPPHTFNSCRILAKILPGYYFFDGPHIVPGVHYVQNTYVVLNLFNDSDKNQFLYRENIITKPRDKEKS